MSSTTEAKVLSGNDLEIEIPNISFGKFLFHNIRKKTSNVLINPKNGISLTCQQLIERSIKIANCFKKSGFKEGDVIAVVCQNRIDYFVPLLASSYLGIIAQPMTSHLSLRELSDLIELSQPKWLFCCNETLAKCVQLKKEFTCIEELISFEPSTEKIKTLDGLLQIECSIEQFEPEDIPGDKVAYLFNSSGTSGVPKCVMLTHKNMVSGAVVSRIAYGFQKNDVTVSPLPLSHIYGFLYCLSTVLASAKYIVMDRFIPQLYLKYIELYHANKLSCPPALLRFLAESNLTEAYDLTSIQEVTHGSAPLPEKIRIAVTKKFNVQLREGYGATETTGTSIGDPRRNYKSGSSGCPLPTVIVKIRCPKTNKLVDPYQPGEICIKGPTVMKGYMRNIQATTNAFDEEGYFKTGDIGYYDEDEYVYVIDRLKELIKYKGYQISPTELEFIITQHPAVKEACVIGAPDERCGEIPVAYVILEDGKTASEKEIIDLVAAFMFSTDNVNFTKWLYGGVQFVQEIPKTASGKHKRRELKELHIKSVNQNTDKEIKLY